MTVHDSEHNPATQSPPRYLLLFVCVAALSIYFDLIPFLHEFNFDVPRVIIKMAKHPMAWINWARVVGLSIAALILWLKYQDNDNFPTIPTFWLVFGVTLILGIPEGMLLFLYLRQRHKEQCARKPTMKTADTRRHQPFSDVATTYFAVTLILL